MRIAWLLLAVGIAAAACVDSTQVICSDGRICSAGSRCDLANSRCISPGQLSACTGLGDGDACTVVGAPGSCRAGVCEVSICGDGIRNASESCEGADLGGATCLAFGFTNAAGLTCTDSCKYDTSACTGACGDSVKDDNELCDGAALGGADCTTAGFYYGSGLTCSPYCTYDVTQCHGRCGDGVLDAAFEICDGADPVGACLDYGFDAGPLTCSLSCGQSFADCARFGWQSEGIDDRTEWSDIAGDWAVGAKNGDAAHFTGSAWTYMPSTSTSRLVAVATASGGSVWAVGNGGAIVHFTGTWATVTPPDAAQDYKAVWVAPAGDVLVASASQVWQRTGATWTELTGITTSTLTSLGGSSASDVWATAGDGKLWRWNGSTWSTSYTDANVAFSDCVVIGGEAWFAGIDNSMQLAVRVHWSASTFTSETTVEFADLPPSLIATSTSNVWMSANGALFHFDGVIWRTLHVATNVTGLSALGPDSAVAVAPQGALRFTGQAFMYPDGDMGPPVSGGLSPLSAMWGTDGIIVALDGTNAVRHDGTTWIRDVFLAQLTAVWGTAVDNVWVGDAKGVAHRWDGGTWNDSSLVPQPGPITAIGGSGPSDVWAISSDAVDSSPTTYRFDGGNWTRHDLASNAALIAIGSTGANDAWVASSSALFRWAGAAWAPVTGLPTTQLDGLAVVASNNVIVATAHQALHYNGTTWKVLPLPLDVASVRFAVLAPDDIFAATYSKLAHFDGARWAPVRLPADAGDQLLNLSGSRRGLDALFFGFNCTRVRCNPFIEVQTLVRKRPWVCRTSETACADGVDDDCDGTVDGADADCP